MADIKTNTIDTAKHETAPLPSAPVKEVADKGFLESLPAPIAGIIRRTQERITSTLVDKPMGVIQKVLDTMTGFRDRFMKSSLATTLGLHPTPEASAPVPTPTTTTTLKTPEMSSQGPYEEADKKRIMDFEEKALESFAKISHEVSPNKINKILRDPPDPNHLDPKNLNTVAAERLKQIKEMPKFDHPDTNFLTENDYAENISRVYIDEGGIDIAKDFMDSEVHRRNMLGSHNRLGVAMEMAYDQEKQKYYYYVVAIYAGGKSVPKDQKLDAVDPLPKIDSGESAVDVLLPYFDAFDRQTGGKIKHELDVEMSKVVDEKLVKEGETKGGLIYKLSDESGKIVIYGVRKHPPFLTRDENGKKVYVLFKDLADDFAKAPDARQIQPQKPSPTETPTAEDLKKQFALPAYQKPEQKIEQAQPQPEEEFAGHA